MYQYDSKFCMKVTDDEASVAPLFMIFSVALPTVYITPLKGVLIVAKLLASITFTSLSLLFSREILWPLN